MSCLRPWTWQHHSLKRKVNHYNKFITYIKNKQENPVSEAHEENLWKKRKRRHMEQDLVHTKPLHSFLRVDDVKKKDDSNLSQIVSQYIALQGEQIQS